MGEVTKISRCPRIAWTGVPAGPAPEPPGGGRLIGLKDSPGDPATQKERPGYPGRHL